MNLGTFEPQSPKEISDINKPPAQRYIDENYVKSYWDSVNILEKYFGDTVPSIPELELIQKQIDSLDKKYPESVLLGSDRYKIYELQALVDFYSYNDESSLEYINYAIDVRGGHYDKADWLLSQLNQDVDSSKILDNSGLDYSQNMNEKERSSAMWGGGMIGLSIGIIGIVINGLGVLGILLGIIALVFDNPTRGKELVLNGLIGLVIGFTFFGLSAFLRRDKK